MENLMNKFLTCAVVFCALLTAGAHAQDDTLQQETEDCCPEVVLTSTFKTDEKGKIVNGEDGLPIIVELRKETKTSSAPRKASTVAKRRNPRVTLRASCTTSPQNGTNRRSCNSDVHSHTLPVGYWFVENTKSVSWHHRRGSTNKAYVTYADYVEVLPGFKAPRTVRFQVHARSKGSGGIGTRGKSDASLTIDYLEIPN